MAQPIVERSEHRGVIGRQVARKQASAGTTIVLPKLGKKAKVATYSRLPELTFV